MKYLKYMKRPRWIWPNVFQEIVETHFTNILRIFSLLNCWSMFIVIIPNSAPKRNFRYFLFIIFHKHERNSK